MKLKNQCVSLELAKKLKELGVKQDGFFSWSIKDFETHEPEVTTTLYAGGIYGKGVDCSAFTATELFTLLPETISRETVSGYENNRVNVYKKDGFNSVICYYYGYHSKEHQENGECCRSYQIFSKDKNLANAIAGFYIEWKRIKEFNPHLF